MFSPSIRAAAKRVVAGGLFLYSLSALTVYWQSLLSSRSLTDFVTDPWAVTFSLSVSAMLVGVGVATFGFATETFGQYRSSYLRVVRGCGAVGLVAVAGMLLVGVLSVS